MTTIPGASPTPLRPVKGVPREIDGTSAPERPRRAIPGTGWLRRLSRIRPDDADGRGDVPVPRGAGPAGAVGHLAEVATDPEDVTDDDVDDIDDKADGEVAPFRPGDLVEFDRMPVRCESPPMAGTCV